MSNSSPIWTAQQLAAFLGLSVGWVYRRSGRSSSDPIPRCPGVGVLRFNTKSPEFQRWLQRQVGMIHDNDEASIQVDSYETT